MSVKDIKNQSNFDIALALLQGVKVKDPFTFYHCCRVGQAARQLAKAMGLGEQERTLIEYSGLLHDIGKVAIPDRILLKPSSLTGEEFEVMKSHAELSVEMLEPFLERPFFRFVVPGVRYHHEKFNGKGYPFGLRGTEIPLAARIIAVVDTVDAMTNTRPYRKALSMEKAFQELRDFSGTQFDPDVVAAYLSAQENKKEMDLEPAELIEKIIKAA